MGVQLMSVDEHQAGRHAGDTGPGGWAVGERLSASCPSPAGWRVARHAHATGQRGVARPLLWITLHSWTYCVSVSVCLSLSLSLCVCVCACVCVCVCVRAHAGAPCSIAGMFGCAPAASDEEYNRFDGMHPDDGHAWLVAHPFY